MTKRTRLLALAAALVVLPLAALPQATADHAVDSTWIVTLTPGVDPVGSAAVLAAAAGGTVGHVYSSVLGGFSFKGTALGADVLRASPLVASVVASGPVHLAQAVPDPQLAPTGVQRISADSARSAGHTGAGVTVAVIDSGIDVAHPDLSANVHPTLGANCSNPLLPPLDDNSHGTHVAGTIAAADNGIGVVGVAPAATLVPVKAFDAAGESTWDIVICGIDYVAAHAAEIDVANMSFGDLSTDPTACDGVTAHVIDALRQAVCDLVDAGVIAVAAAGNNMIDSAGFVPAAFPEVVTVSGYSDLDGQPGGIQGCLAFGELCDDSFANLFSNHGSRVDVIAPGLEILSTMPGGLYATKDGTSMAAPHVSGAVALVLAAAPGLSTDEVRARLMRTGECPDGTAAGDDLGCGGQGTWLKDPDSEAEPLIDALRAASEVPPPPADVAPTAAISSPAAGSTVGGTTLVQVAAADDVDVAGALVVLARIDGGAWQTAVWNAVGGLYEMAWNTRTVANGSHVVSAQAIDSFGHVTAATPVTVTVANAMHVGDLDGAVQPGKKTWKAKVTVTVHSGAEALVDGAVVSFTWSGSTSGSGSCTTTRKGVCSLTSGAIANGAGPVTFTVTNVARSGQAYTPATNHDPDSDSTGTVITVG